MSLEKNEGRLNLNFEHQLTFDLSIENRDVNKPMQVSIWEARDIYWEMKARLDELGKELEKRKVLEEKQKNEPNSEAIVIKRKEELCG